MKVKTLLSILLLTILNFFLLPSAMFAAEVQEVKLVRWNLSDYAYTPEFADYDKEFEQEWTDIRVPSSYYGNTPDHIKGNNPNEFWEVYSENDKPVLDFTFPQPVEISRIVYGSRSDADLKGFAEEFEIYTSENGQPDDSNWTKVAHGTGSATGKLCKIDLEKPIKAQYVRFRYVKRRGTHPSCRYMHFYRKDTDEDFLNNCWGNYTHTSFKDGITDDQVTNTINGLKQKSWYNVAYKDQAERAEKVLSGEIKFDSELVRSNEANKEKPSSKAFLRIGDVAGYARNTLKFPNGTTNRQVTGIWYPSDEVIHIWVHADVPTDKLPKIRWAQPYGYWASWHGNMTQLVEGENIITVPRYKTIDYKTYDIVAGCAAYIENPWNEKEQTGNVDVYLEGGRTFPVYHLGDDIDAYMKELRAHADRVRADHTAEMDVTELVSNHLIMTVQATRADELYGARGHNAEMSLTEWDKTIHRCLEFEGIQFDKDQPYYDIRNEHLNENYRVSQVWDYGWMFTAGEHIGVYTGPEAQDVLIDCLDKYGNSNIGPNWGLIHEWGHSVDIPARSIQETTNNMAPYFESTHYPDFVRNLEDIYRANRMALPGYIKGTMFKENRYNFMPFWLVESYFPGWWGKVSNYYRYTEQNDANGFNVNGNNITDRLSKTERMVLYSSLAAEYDLRYWYEMWGLNIDQNESPFVAENASQDFKDLFQKYLDDGSIKTSVDGFDQLPLWYEDRDQYNRVVAAINSEDGKESLHIYKEDSQKPPIVSVDHGKKTVEKEENGVKTKETYDTVSVTITKNTDDNHLCYLVESRKKNDDSSEWTNAGYTHGGVFIDERRLKPKQYDELEFRVRAMDRSFHTSPYSDAKTFETKTGVARVGGRTYDSLADAVNSAESGSTIELLKDCNGSDVTISNKTLTIEPADSSITLARLGDNALFILDKNANLTLQSSGDNKLTLDGYLADSKNAAIRGISAATFKAEDVTFKNFINVATNGEGYGSCFNASDAGVKSFFNNCTFSDNRAENGGAVASRGTMTIYSSEFSNNTARSSGGAIYNYSGGILYSKENNIHSNIAVNGGGAYLNGASTFCSDNIHGNFGKYGGGLALALENHRSGAIGGSVVKPTKIENNTSLNGDAINYISGTIVVGNADIKASSSDNVAIQIDNTSFKVNGNKSDVINYTNIEDLADFTGVKVTNWFEDINQTEIEGIIAESGSNTITSLNKWVEGDVKYDVDDLGRPQPVIALEGFTPSEEEIDSKVILTGTKTKLELEYKGEDEGTQSGVYVARGGNVRFVLNEGTINSGEITGYTSGVVTYLPTNVTRKGYSFVGWFDNAACSGTSVRSIPADQKGDVTFYAKWSSGIYWINYRPNGGTMPEDTEWHRSVDQTSLLKDPVRPDYKFLGWYTNDKFEGDPITSIPAGTDKDMMVFAKYDHHKDKGVKVSETPATCTKPGQAVYQYKCVDCEEVMPTEIIEIPTKGHKWGPWTAEAKESECTGQKLTTRTCTVCGLVETQGGNESEGLHEWGNFQVVKEANCDTDGLKQAQCQKCSAVKDEVIPATDHKFDDNKKTTEVRSDPTCTLPGVSEVSNTCTVCGKSMIVETIKVEPKGHTWKTTEDYQNEGNGEITVDEDYWYIEKDKDAEFGAGATYKRVCKICNTVEKKQEDFEHDWEEEPTIITEATCITSGLQAIKCRTCGALKDRKVINALGHDFTDTTKSTCLRCPEPNVDYINPSPDEGTSEPEPGHVHTWSTEWGISTQPTCTTSGVKYHYCIDPSCTEKTDETVIPALGHNFGSEGNLQFCQVCEAKNPNYVDHEHVKSEPVTIQEPDCDTCGLAEYYCTECNEELGYEILFAQGHKFVNGICTVCNAEQPQVEPSNPEIPSDQITEGPGFDGQITPDEKYDCLSGDHYYPENEEWAIDIETSCKHPGVKAKHCKICGQVSETNGADFIESPDHDFGDNQPSCINCGKANPNYVEPHEHIYENEVEVEPTCVADGVDRVTCTICHQVIEVKTIPRLGHDFGSNNQAPTCLRDNCDAGNPNYKIDEDSSHTHSFDNFYTVDKELTCTETGNKSRHCSLWACPERTDVKVIPALGHNFKNGYCTHCGISEDGKDQQEPVEEVLTDITFDKPTVYLTTLSSGKTSENITITTEPAEFTGNFNWISENPSIVTVEGNGKTAVLKAGGEGQTKVSVQSGDIIKTITVRVANTSLITDNIELKEIGTDHLQVTAYNVRSNPALPETNNVNQVSFYSWSQAKQEDMNAKVAARVDGTNDFTYTFPVNETTPGNHYLDAGRVKVHVYSTNNSGQTEFLGSHSYSWGDQGEGTIKAVGYSQNIGFITPGVGSNELIGTTGEARQLEGIRLASPVEGLNLVYSVHASNIGWSATRS